jgi:outer membrane immunogenic protein
MLRQVLLGLLGAAAVAGSANAADMYRAPEAVGGYKDDPVSYVSWAGFYVGAHVGAAFGELNVKDIDEVPGTFKNKPTDVFGGAQVGYNLQRGNWVFGPEIDLGGMGFNNTAVQPNTGGIIKSTIESGFYADVTGRLGYAFGPSLVYAKGGVAFFEGDVKILDVGEASVSKRELTGWTVGGGYEYKISPAWSLKAEYQYFDFGSETLRLPSDGDRYRADLTAHTVKVGVNYFVSPAYEPLK